MRQEKDFVLFYFCWRWTLDQLSRAEATEQLNLQKGKTQRRWLHPAWHPGRPSPLWQRKWRNKAAECQDAVVWGILTCTRRLADRSVVMAPIHGHWGSPWLCSSSWRCWFSGLQSPGAACVCVPGMLLLSLGMLELTKCTANAFMYL